MTNDPVYQIHNIHPHYHRHAIQWTPAQDRWYSLIDFNSRQVLKRMAMTRESAKERNIALVGSNLEWRPE